jgi:hypothetical protein
MKGIDKVCPGAEALEKAANKKAFADNSKDLDRFIPALKASKWNAMLTDAFKITEWNTQFIGIFSDVNKCYQFYANEPMEGTADIFDWMKYIFGVYYYYENFSNPDVTKLKTTNLAKLVLEKMDEAIQGNSKKLRYLGLSGHEENIFPFMMGYNLLSIECLKKNAQEPDKTKLDKNCHGSPEFAANIIWELSKKKKAGTEIFEYFIRVFYDGELVNFCADKATPEKYCSYESFKTHFTDKFILDSAKYAQTCGAPAAPAPYVKTAPAPENTLWFYTSVVLIIIVLILGGFILYSQLKPSSDGTTKEPFAKSNP